MFFLLPCFCILSAMYSDYKNITFSSPHILTLSLSLSPCSQTLTIGSHTCSIICCLWYHTFFKWNGWVFLPSSFSFQVTFHWSLWLKKKIKTKNWRRTDVLAHFETTISHELSIIITVRDHLFESIENLVTWHWLTTDTWGWTVLKSSHRVFVI